MCRCVLLVVLWLLIGTRSRLLVVGLLSIAEALCPSLCLFGTILVTLCLMMWDWRVSRAEPMLYCWHDLLFLFCLLLFYHFLPSMGWFCDVGLFGLIECPHSFPALHSGLQNNNNNNNGKKTEEIKSEKIHKKIRIDCRKEVHPAELPYQLGKVKLPPNSPIVPGRR